MKKVLLISAGTAGIIGIVGIVLAMVFLPDWFGVLRTPSIEGRVVDVSTGQPIENVVITAGWNGSSFGIFDKVGHHYHGEAVISDKNGKFRIPAYKKIRILSRFNWIEIGIYHPVYVSQRARWPDMWQPNSNGVVHWNVKLMGLEQKYMAKEGDAQGTGISTFAGEFEGFTKSMNAGYYWMILIDKERPINIENDFKVWDRVARHLFVRNQAWIMESFNNDKDKIRIALLRKK